MTTPRSWSKVLGWHGMVEWGKYSQINHTLLYFIISQKWRGFQKPHYNILILVGTNHLRIVEIRIKSWLLHPAAPKLRRGFWKPHENLIHFVASKSWLVSLAKYIWRYIPDCDAVSRNPMIFCYAQPNIFGGSQIHLAIHPWTRRVLENQSHVLIPSQMYSAAAKYIWLYIPGCDGVWKINHISLCPAKTNWRTSGAPDQNKTLKDQDQRTLSQKDRRTSQQRQLEKTGPTSLSTKSSSNRCHEEECAHLRSIVRFSGTSGW